MEQKIPDKKRTENIKIEKIKKELKECQELGQEYLTGWQRARADFINYKKEEEERIKRLLEWQKENLILKILPILDNFQLAEENLDEGLKKQQNVSGLRQIKKQLEEFLKTQGAEELDVLDKEFDPNTSEAVEEIEKKDVQAGIVLEIIQKGYCLNGKIIRPAKVVVNK